ncbi:hypothetical protein RUM43_008321 [Polyplax serrata]|uniref:TLC domain-containing protein n=1 Tax=Polyplax serrata TaxID=468196 RepID=A0AAN8P2Z9_POLSC
MPATEKADETFGKECNPSHQNRTPYCYAPFGIYLGIKNVKPKKAAPVPELEKLYQSGKKATIKDIKSTANQLRMTERQVERWLRVRRAMDRPTTLKKFCENSFRCTYYIYSFIYGLMVLWDKPWLWNINYCWYGYPHQSVSNDIWWYYMISLSFYWSLAVSHFFDVKHKDFWQMFIHHIATIVLMDFSWVCNMHRIGSLVLVIHDCADVLLEGAKMAKYANYQRVCDLLFVIFTLVWIATRLGLYPFWIMRNTTIQAPKISFVPAVDIAHILDLFNIEDSLQFIISGKGGHSLLACGLTSACRMEGDIRSSSDEEIEDSPSPSENGIKKTD